MWMEVHIYSNVNAKSQAGNIWVKDIITKQKRQSQKNSAREFKNLCILPKNSEGLQFRRERSWGLHIYENIYKKLLQLYLVLQGRVQLEHSSHIVNISVKATY